MDTHKRKRIEIVVERRLAFRVIDRVRAEPRVHGYTVLPCLGGAGRSGVHEADPLTDLQRDVLVTVVCGEPVARELLDGIVPLLDEIGGVAWLSDVEVIRVERF